VRAGYGAEQIVSGVDICNPISQRFIDCVFQGATSGFHGYNLCTQKFHARHIECLAFCVNFTHVNDTLKPKERSRRSRGDTVLTSAGFSDYALLAHALCKQSLPKHVIDFV
jgi:hypothetical protein